MRHQRLWYTIKIFFLACTMVGLEAALVARSILNYRWLLGSIIFTLISVLGCGYAHLREHELDR